MKPSVDAICDTLWGLLEEDHQVKGVPDLFAPGTVCEAHYKQMLAACQQLNDRLGSATEDPDVEQVVNSLLAICREIGEEMYHCGRRFR